VGGKVSVYDDCTTTEGVYTCVESDGNETGRICGNCCPVELSKLLTMQPKRPGYVDGIGRL
jgi:hypothetical protein